MKEFNNVKEMTFADLEEYCDRACPECNAKPELAHLRPFFTFRLREGVVQCEHCKKIFRDPIRHLLEEVECSK